MIRYQGKVPVVTPKGLAVLIGLQALLKAVNKPKRKPAKKAKPNSSGSRL